MSIDVSVIIVSYNTRDITLRCLRAVYADLEGLSSEVWVVDNASTDGSQTAIRELFPNVHLIENKQNVGFGAANNQAMKQAVGDFFLLLNSDAFLKPGAIPTLINYARTHPNVGIVGPQLLNADGSLQPSWYRYPSVLPTRLINLWFRLPLKKKEAQKLVSGDPYEGLIKDYFLSGACLLVRREVYKEVGGFDEAFFLYCEETDWERRIQSRGWNIGYTPFAKVIHLHGVSGETRRLDFTLCAYNSGDYFIWKYHGLLGLLFFRVMVIIVCVLKLIRDIFNLILVPRKRSITRFALQVDWRRLVSQFTRWYGGKK